MKKDFIFDNLIKTLQDRIPQRGKLAEVLSEQLGIEKEAVYRRLRGSVPFSFQEVYKIAFHFGLSLDSIAENAAQVTRQMTSLAIEFLDPQEKDFNKLDDFTMNMRQLKEDPNSETGAIGSTIPSSFYVNYEHIYRFYLLKWSHQFWNSQKIKKYAEIKIPERLKHHNQEFVKNIQSSPKSAYVLDRQFVGYFVNDVKFFFDIRQITREDVLLLKKDLHLFLDDLERYAVNGHFDTGNKMDIFLSNVHFEANYYYVDSTYYKLTIIRSFAFNDFYSFNESVFQDMKKWLNFLKRTSTLISEGSVAERVLFFEQQRKLIDSM